MSVSHNDLSGYLKGLTPANVLYAPAIVSKADIINKPIINSASVSNVTINAIALVSGLVNNTGTIATNIITDAAVNVYAYLIAQGILPSVSGTGANNSTSFPLTIVNTSTQTATLNPSTGMTPVGVMTVPTNTSKTFTIVYNSPTSFTVFG